MVGAVDWNKGGEEHRRAVPNWGNTTNRDDEGKITGWSLEIQDLDAGVDN